MLLLVTYSGFRTTWADAYQKLPVLSLTQFDYNNLPTPFVITKLLSFQRLNINIYCSTKKIASLLFYLIFCVQILQHSYKEYDHDDFWLFYREYYEWWRECFGERSIPDLNDTFNDAPAYAATDVVTQTMDLSKRSWLKPAQGTQG